MPTPRRNHISGVFTKIDGQKAIVVANGEFADVFDIDQLKWRPTFGFPLPVDYARAVQYEDYFLVVGGSYNDGQNQWSNHIYQYDSDEIWKTKVQSLIQGRSEHVVLSVPDYMTYCD